MQEALLHAFLDLAELRDRDRFVAWLLGIVMNLAKSRLRLRREVPVEDWSGGRAIRGFVWMDAEPTPDARHEARELHDIVWKALAELPSEQRETAQLHHVDGLRVWEIAALVGVPSGTVRRDCIEHAAACDAPSQHSRASRWKAADALRSDSR